MSKTEENGEEPLPDTVQQIKEGIEARIEAESIGVEFLKQLQPLVESRRKLQESEDALQASIRALQDAIASFTDQFNCLAELKKENLVLEREMLAKIKIALK